MPTRIRLPTKSAPAPGRLREELEDACDDSDHTLEELTVLAVQNDPYRVDTPAGHRDGKWLADQIKLLDLADGARHLRGLHYIIASAGGIAKPNGTPYVNDEDDWLWIGQALKAARWLGYVPFERIVDQRNAAPVIRVFEPRDLEPHVRVEAEVVIGDLEPRVNIDGFQGVQPFKLVLFGEKSSLEELLGPIAAEHEADLYLPTGEISDTLVYSMARVAAEDGRRMVVFTFSDCDPSGWQMPISIARKLQAFRDLEFPDLAFEVRRVALTPDQVREHELPHTPLKEGEKRAEKWKTAMGVEQTEIDALAALQPDLLREIALDALAPFFDHELEQRVDDARREWVQAAQSAFDEQADQGELQRIRGDAEARLAELGDVIDVLNENLIADIGEDIDLPEAVIPEPEIEAQPYGLPLIDSDDSYTDATLRLIESKAYGAANARHNGRGAQ